MATVVEDDKDDDWDLFDDGRISRRRELPNGDIYDAARAGDFKRVKYLLECGVNINARDDWDSVPLYYACLCGHMDIIQLLLEQGAICSEHTFDGERCHYAALTLEVRALLRAYEARPPILRALESDLKVMFFRSGNNSRYLDPTLGGGAEQEQELAVVSPPDIVFHLEGKSISAHRAILAARSSYFARKFQGKWKNRDELRLCRKKLGFSPLLSFISFCYMDRLEIPVEEMENLIEICKVCGCLWLGYALEKEQAHLMAPYSHKPDSQGLFDPQQRKKCIIDSASLPDDERLQSDLKRLFNKCLENSGEEVPKIEDFADVCFVVEGSRFRCHRSILSARSDYFKTRIFRSLEDAPTSSNELVVIEEHHVSAEIFEKLLHYMYTNHIVQFDLEQAEELLDAASRYLLFPLKRLVAEIIVGELENATPAEICRWLLVADLYTVWKLKEHCLDTIAINFEVFAATAEFRYMLQRLPPPSGEASVRTTAPSDNVLDDLREKWLMEEGAELDKRDESARHFDRRLELLKEGVE